MILRWREEAFLYKVSKKTRHREVIWLNNSNSMVFIINYLIKTNIESPPSRLIFYMLIDTIF